MKKKIIYLLIIILAIVLQTSLLPIISKAGTAGDAVLMLVLAWTVVDGFFGFLPWAIVAGILYDLASFEALGSHVLVFIFVVYAVSFFSRRLSIELKGIGIFLILVFIFGATIFSHLLLEALWALKVRALGQYWKLLGNFGWLFWQTIYDIFIFAIWFVFIKKIKKFFILDV